MDINRASAGFLPTRRSRAAASHTAVGMALIGISPRFSEDSWKAAVKEAFCEPGEGCFGRSTDDVDEFVFSRTAPLMAARSLY